MLCLASSPLCLYVQSCRYAHLVQLRAQVQRWCGMRQGRTYVRQVATDNRQRHVLHQARQLEQACSGSQQRTGKSAVHCAFAARDAHTAVMRST